MNNSVMPLIVRTYHGTNTLLISFHRIPLIKSAVKFIQSAELIWYI